LTTTTVRGWRRRPGDELVLRPGRARDVAVESFAFDLLGGADHDHGEVGVGGERDGLGDLGLVVAVLLGVELEGHASTVAAPRPVARSGT
jgi:hypothetical protein